MEWLLIMAIYHPADVVSRELDGWIEERPIIRWVPPTFPLEPDILLPIHREIPLPNNAHPEALKHGC